ncbi:MFS transporter [Streptomyces murinus]|uniref:MFS transporter n=1 Tax=Streptomyces murinus TaxID=33900 RepID=UPI003F48840B
MAGACPLPAPGWRPGPAPGRRRHHVHRAPRLPDHHRAHRHPRTRPRRTSRPPPPHRRRRPCGRRVFARPRRMSRTELGVQQTRVVLTGYFLGLGVVMAVWGARMPAVQHTAHLTTGRLSLVLLAAALGMVAGLQTGGRLAARPARLPLLMVCGSVALAAALALLGQCHSLASLLVAALAFGAAHGVLDVAVNTAAVRCQNMAGRPIMSRLHAAYSIGALGGAALAAATAGTTHRSLFLAAGAALAATTLLAARLTAALSGTQSWAGANHEPGPARSGSGKVWLLGALAAAALLGEGAAADWAAVHVHTLHTGTAVTASAFALYSTGMAIGRLTGDRLTTRFGAPTVVRTGAVLAAAALATGVQCSSVPVALAGWAVFGLGLSTTVPCLITAAGRRGPRAVATVSVTGYLGLLTGPALIGALASATTLAMALLLPALLAAALAVLAHRALETTTP